VLEERYALGELIGRGGMAEVFRAEDQLLERDVAVKVLREMSPGSNNDERFKAEARTLAGLDHPNLVTVLDAGTSDRGQFLVMELVDGSTLSEHRGSRMPPERAAALGRDLASALGYVHRRGIVHRDIKPGNILLDTEGRVRLTDFGIARMLSEAARHTATGATIGTAAYLSPEQVRGSEISPAADIYALGLVLLEALTGERTYTGAPMEAALARLHNPPQVPGWLNDRWREVLVAMTLTEPEDRATAFEVEQRLGVLADPGSAPVASTPGPEWTRATRHQDPAERALAAPGHATSHRISRRKSHRHGLIALGVAVLVLGAASLLFTRVTSNGSQAPTDVPSHLRQPLQDLHDAVDG
jgi:serine/threonine protein kinase